MSYFWPPHLVEEYIEQTLNDSCLPSNKKSNSTCFKYVHSTKWSYCAIILCLTDQVIDIFTHKLAKVAKWAVPVAVQNDNILQITLKSQ